MKKVLNIAEQAAHFGGARPYRDPRRVARAGCRGGQTIDFLPGRAQARAPVASLNVADFLMAHSRLPAASLASESRAAWVGLALLVSLAVFGGASRADALNQPIIRILSIVAASFFLITATRIELRRARDLLRPLGLLILLCALQLLPLPPGIWASLPGRGELATALDRVGALAVWRPLSLAPDRTINVMLSSLPVFATLVALSRQSRPSLDQMLPIVLVGIMAISGLIGLSQIYSDGPYFYRITNDGNAVGLFANRNHFAFFLAMGFPMLSHLALSGSRKTSDYAIQVTCGTIAIALLALLITNGSRGGLVLGLVGLLGGAAIILTSSSRKFTGREIAFGGAALALAVTLLAALFWFSRRSLTLARFLQSGDGTEEMRLLALPTILEMLWSYFPLGAGMGAFENAYKMVEPDELISGVYLNHVHNDFLEFGIDASVPGLALLGYLAVILIRGVRRKFQFAQYRSVTLMAAVIAVQFAIGSALDYPLRTAFMSALFCYAAFLIIRPIDDSPTDVRRSPADAER